MGGAIVFMIMLVTVKAYHLHYDDSYEEYDEDYSRSLSYNTKTQEHTTDKETSYDRTHYTTPEETYDRKNKELTTSNAIYGRITQEANARATRYEVTENVIDVPDDRTRGPIIANYTIARGVNTLAPPGDTSSESQFNQRKVTEKVKLMNVRYKPDEIKERQDSAKDAKPNDFWDGIKEVFLNGITRVIKKHNLQNIFDG